MEYLYFCKNTESRHSTFFLSQPLYILTYPKNSGFIFHSSLTEVHNKVVFFFIFWPKSYFSPQNDGKVRFFNQYMIINALTSTVCLRDIRCSTIYNGRWKHSKIEKSTFCVARPEQSVVNIQEGEYNSMEGRKM